MKLRSIGSIFCSILIVAMLSGTAWAGGFAVARFGGEHGNVMTDDPSAIYYNPAGLAMGQGHRILVDAVFAWRSASYERFPEANGIQPPSELDIEANTGEGTVHNAVISPSFAFVTDFGTDLPLGVGVGFYTPFGGRSGWDEVDAVDGAPGAFNGAQRWYVIEGVSQTSYLSLGVAYEIEAIGLSLGVTGNLLMSELNTIRARNADGTDDLLTASGEMKEGRSWLEASSTDWSMGFGLLWEALENALWVGVSYQSPQRFGETMEMEGTLDNAFSIAIPTQEKIIATQDLPDIVRFGVRWRPNVDLELRLSGDWQNWSRFEQMCIRGNDSSIDTADACATNADGSQVNEEFASNIVQILGRRWENTWGLKFGASYWLNNIELLASIAYDSNAVPDNYLEPALMDFDKVIASLGAGFAITDWFNLMFTAANVFYIERDTQGADTANTLQPPMAQPNSEGIYRQNIFVFDTTLNFQFGGGDSYSGNRRGDYGGEIAGAVEVDDVEDAMDATEELIVE